MMRSKLQSDFMVKQIKYYLHESGNTSERKEIFKDQGLDEAIAANLADESICYEVELLIDVETKKIIGCNGYLLSNEKY